MTIVIENNLKASKKSAEELHGKLMVEHKMAMLSYDMKDLVDSILDLGRKLASGDERMRALKCSETDRIEFENRWAKFNRALENLASDALGMIKEFNSDGYAIEGHEALRKLRNELRVANTFQIERVRHSIKQADDGKLTPFSAVRDELRN
jgi:hypothetical protein